MPMSRRARSALIAAVLVVGVAVVASPSASAVPEAAVPTRLASALPLSGALGEFHPLTPARIYDSRSPGIGTTPGVKPATPTNDAVFDVQVLGVGGVPANSSDVYAVIANVTVIEPTVDGFLSVFPKGEPWPGTSSVNFRPGQIVPNLALMRPGADGQVRVLLNGLSPGQAHVAIDVFGWVSTSSFPTRGARLLSVSPGRLFDSRSAAPFRAGESRAVQVRGESRADFQIPNTADVVGVVLNVTGINNRSASQGTFLSVLPTAPSGVPATSNLNLARGAIRANLVIVPLGPDGRIHLYNAQGESDIALDVVGYLQNGVASPRAGRIIPLRAPFRAIDTRQGPSGPLRLGAGQAEPWDFRGTIASTTVAGDPIGKVSSMIGNLTGTDFERQYYNSPEFTFLSMVPFAAAGPSVSNLNFGPGEAVANQAVARLNINDQVFVYNAEGFVHYIYDVSAMVLAD
jgi:hypothetical protein